MAGDKTITIKISGENKDFQKSMRETQKITAAQSKRLIESSKKQEKFNTESHKDFVKTAKKKEKHYDKELKHHQQLGKLSKTQSKDDSRSFDTMARKTKQEEQRASRSFKQMMGDFKRSPVGKFATGTQGGRVTRMGGRALRGGASLGGGMLGMLMGASMAGYQRLGQYSQALAGVSGMGSGASVKRGMGRRMGAGLGYNLVESAGHAKAMGRATGVVGPRELQQVMRSTGMDAGETSGIFGALAQGGTSFTGAGGDIAGVRKGQSKGGREMQRMIAAGMESGLKRGRLPEFFAGVVGLMKEQQRISVGHVGSSDYSKTLALFGKSGKEGMRGARGAAVLGKLQKGIQRPGGGEAGKAFMLQAMGFGKPGGNTDFYEAEKQMEKGATGENLMKVMTESRKQFGQGKEGVLTLQQLFGVSKEQGEELIKIYDSNSSSKEKLKKIEETMDKSKSLAEQSRNFLSTTAAMSKRMASRFDISIGHGASAAKYIQQIEDWQTKLVTYMFQALEWLSKIYEEVKIAINSWLKGEDTAARKSYIEAERQKQKDNKIVDRKSRIAALEKSYEKYRKEGDVRLAFNQTASGVRSIMGGASIGDEDKTRRDQDKDRRRLLGQSDAQIKLAKQLEDRGIKLTSKEERKAAVRIQKSATDAGKAGRAAIVTPLHHRGGSMLKGAPGIAGSAATPDRTTVDLLKTVTKTVVTERDAFNRGIVREVEKAAAPKTKETTVHDTDSRKINTGTIGDRGKVGK